MNYIHGTEAYEQQRLATLNQLVNAPFLEFLELGNARSILDVGSGLGLLARQVAARCPSAEVIGVEYSEMQLRAAAGGLPANLRFLQGDAHALPFPEARFDVVYCRFVFEHVPRPAVVCAEMYRVLRPGGKVFVQENDISLQRFDPPVPKFDAIWRKVAVLQERLGGDALIGSKLFRLLQQAGFRDVRLSFAPDAYRAGQEALTLWVENLIAIVRGCEAQLVSHGLATQMEVEAALEEVAPHRTRDDASSWFFWNRASGIK
jgi:ubiquinone/menaquinone biosynthesis C-methylase UbiE